MDEGCDCKTSVIEVNEEPDSGSKVVGFAGPSELLIPLEYSVVDEDGLIILELAACSKVSEKDELTAFEAPELATPDELCDGTKDTDGLMMLKLPEVLACSEADDNGVLAVVETPESVKSELSAEKADADEPAKLGLSKVVDCREVADINELIVFEALLLYTSVEL